MTTKQRRFLVIMFWVGPPARGALTGPVLVSTSDNLHFHFWDERDAATFGPGDYEIVKVYPPGLTFQEVERRFAQEFPADAGAAWLMRDQVAPPVWRWGDFGQQFGRPCLTA